VKQYNMAQQQQQQALISTENSNCVPRLGLARSRHDVNLIWTLYIMWRAAAPAGAAAAPGRHDG
jgi:hypothetical protein